MNPECQKFRLTWATRKGLSSDEGALLDISQQQGDTLNTRLKLCSDWEHQHQGLHPDVLKPEQQG